ncbi:MAG: hypothetical protein MHMPM18_001644 [Marteilia pararefringens]
MSDYEFQNSPEDFPSDSTSTSPNDGDKSKEDLLKQQESLLQAAELMKSLSKLSINCFDQCVQKVSLSRRTNSISTELENCAKNCTIKNLTKNNIIISSLQAMFKTNE